MRLAVALLLSLALGPLMIFGLRRLHAVDQPCARSSHRTPTLRGGGLAPALAAVGGLLYGTEMTGEALVALLAGSVAFGAIGLAEDLRGVPAMPRLALQLAAAVATLPLLLADLSGPLVWRLVFSAGVVLWLASYVNAFNFMDGINGISVAQVVVAGVAWWVIGRGHGADDLAAAALVVALAALGFLPFNFPHARMFLGDVGSYFLGAWLAVLAVVGLRAGVAFEAMFAPLALYLADTGATLVRRVRRRETWHEPHLDHAYQRLHHGGGWSHARTAATAATLMVVCSVLGAVSEAPSLVARVVADVALAGVVAGYLSLPGALGCGASTSPLKGASA
ncbi:MAG: glycosyl transferase [Acidimicrobiales bacterium]